MHERDLLRPFERRSCRLGLGISHSMDGLLHSIRLNSGDGINVSRQPLAYLNRIAGGGITLANARAPTSGGQYHWVSEFSPRSCQRFLSYLVGWISVLGWQTGLASITYIAGTLIQGLIVLNNDDYIFERWHGTLLVIAIVAFAVIFNTALAQRLPMIEIMVLFLHLLGFFGVLIPLWVLAPRNSPEMVFTQFENLGGWPTQGLSFMVGLLTSVYGLLGADSAVHMAEEIRDASVILPRATMWSIAVNGAFGWVMMITFAFTAGNPLYIVDSKTGYPFIQAFYNTTQSKAGTSVMVAIMIINITSSVISTLATVSRQLWSFGRDHGLPGSSFVAHVRLLLSIFQYSYPS